MMNSDRRKREEEIERLVREAKLDQEPDIAFQEEVRQTASAILEKETEKVQKTESPKWRKRAINPTTIGLWLLVLGGGFALSTPSLGAMVIVCAIGFIAWGLFLKSSQK